jgi:hypothetical protein
MGWRYGLAPATLEFGVRFTNERNQGKQVHFVLKYRTPLRVPLYKPRLVVSHRSTCPPPSPSHPREQLYIRYCSDEQQPITITVTLTPTQMTRRQIQS